MDDLILDWLLGVVLALALALVLASTAALGRKVYDLEYQVAAGINGVRRIQSWINIRTHANRVLLGLAFLANSVLVLADVTEQWRTWVGRVAFAVVLLSYTVSSVADWFDERKQVRILLREQQALRATHDEALVAEGSLHAEALEADIETYRRMASEAIANLEAAATNARRARGEPPLEPLADVVPEHQSPVTAAQRATASVATLRARLVAATKALNLPARTLEGDA